MKDAVRKPPRHVPFPTFFSAADEDTRTLPPEQADFGEEDPFLKE